MITNSLLNFAIQMATDDPHRLLDAENRHWLQEDEVIETLFTAHPFFIRNDPGFQVSEKIAKIALKANPFSFYWLSNELQKDKALIQIRDEVQQSTSSDFLIPPSQEKRIFYVCPPDRLEDSCAAKIDPIFQGLSSKELFKAVRFELEHSKPSLSFQNERFTTSPYLLRDSLVALPSGICLIPYSPKTPSQIDKKVEYLLPLYMRPFFLNKSNQLHSRALLGKGTSQKNTDQAKVLCYDYEIPFKQAKTSIEGGNIFLFELNGQKKAIIGETSLYLSLAALEVEITDLDLQEEEISEEAYRIAKNMNLWKQQKEIDYSTLPLSEKIDKYHHIFSDVKDTNKKDLREKAIYWQKKLDLTKQTIASEIEVPLEHIIFLPQTGFHIDLELTVTPEGRVLLHDCALALNQLGLIKEDNMNSDQKLFLTSYLVKAQKRYKSFKSIQCIQYERLLAHNIEAQAVVGELKAYFPTHPTYRLNYMNGVFTPLEERSRFCYVTTGPSHKAEKCFHNFFSEQFKQALGDNIEAVFVDELSTKIGLYKGGVHCLTLEV